MVKFSLKRYLREQRGEKRLEQGKENNLGRQKEKEKKRDPERRVEPTSCSNPSQD